nr:glycerol-3-phosphate dehydrogenase/oxidase [uncultured Marinobacter sp.]
MNRAWALEELRAGNREFDVVVIGGGITGAGVAREAAGSGLRTLLVEQRDFAWGTSSRSSKMVHGGLRYLGSGHLRLARDAVTERQRLMAEAPGLIDPLRFIMPHFRHQFPGPGLFGALLRLYDGLAGTRSRQTLTPGDLLSWVPGLTTRDLLGASGFTDAVTDDARLVLRVLAEARHDGACCLNYVKAVEVLRHEGQVQGVRLQPAESTDAFTVNTSLVINATGAWADRLSQPSPMTLRPLRGSHLVIPWSTLPVTCSVSLFHPADQRPVFAFPWAGTTVLGTTDLDHAPDLDREPAITREEVTYLLAIAGRLFPGTHLDESHILSTWAGVRPVVSDGSGKAPSKENREHDIRVDHGLISVAGGKLTTFRRIAREALALGLGPKNGVRLRAAHHPVFRPLPVLPRPATISHLNWHRLLGFYGPDLPSVLDAGPTEPVLDAAGSNLLWAELCWACTHEDVRHLDDLLLRRTRLGLTVPDGASGLLPELKRRCQPVLGWSDDRWQEEAGRYRAIWQNAYSVPATVPATGPSTTGAARDD